MYQKIADTWSLDEADKKNFNYILLYIYAIKGTVSYRFPLNWRGNKQ